MSFTLASCYIYNVNIKYIEMFNLYSNVIYSGNSEISASLLQSSVSHDPNMRNGAQETFLIVTDLKTVTLCVENSCAA